MLKRVFQRILRKQDNEKADLKPNQQLRIKIGDMPQTFATRVEDVDGEKVCISGISNQELNFSVILPNQKLELFLYTGPFYYKTEAVLKEKVNDPVFVWVLSRPDKFKKYKERRKAFRLDNVVEAAFSVTDALVEEQRKALTTNISVTGLAIASDENLSLHNSINVNLLGAGTIKGEIVWKYRRPDFDKWFYGVQFVEISETQQESLAQYINEKIGKLRWAGFI